MPSEDLYLKLLSILRDRSALSPEDQDTQATALIQSMDLTKVRPVPSLVYLAIEANACEALKALHAGGMPTNTEETLLGARPIHIAVNLKHLAAVKALAGLHGGVATLDVAIGAHGPLAGQFPLDLVRCEAFKTTLRAMGFKQEKALDSPIVESGSGMACEMSTEMSFDFEGEVKYPTGMPPVFSSWRSGIPYFFDALPPPAVPVWQAPAANATGTTESLPTSRPLSARAPNINPRRILDMRTPPQRTSAEKSSQGSAASERQSLPH